MRYISSYIIYMHVAVRVLHSCAFISNSAYLGGVLVSNSSTVTMEASEFHDNNATDSGGVLGASFSIITIASSNFTNNVSPIGAIIYAASRSVIQHSYIAIAIS